MSSHILQEVNAICERVIIINNGKLVASDTPENLGKSISNENKFQLRVAGEERAILDALEGVPGVKYVKSLGRKESGSIDFVVEAEPDVDVRTPIFNALATAGLPILSLQTLDLSLEEIFLEVTRNQSGAMFADVDEEDIEMVNVELNASSDEETETNVEGESEDESNL